MAAQEKEVAALEARVAAWHRSVAAAEASLKAGAEASAQEIVRDHLQPCDSCL